jgi:RND family efflux transporter MFP subunit
VITAQATQYRPTRRYVGTIAPWLEARIGPQFTAAYVDTVLLRPGEGVTRGQVLATLECKSASAQSKAMQLQARAMSATQEALANEAGRLSGLLQGGYASENEVERRNAESKSKQAELMAQNARLVRAALEVDDCVLHAPFDGEVAERLIDPGGFARPGSPILTVVDRGRVRVLIDVPEVESHPSRHHGRGHDRPGYAAAGDCDPAARGLGARRCRDAVCGQRRAGQEAFDRDIGRVGRGSVCRTNPGRRYAGGQ